MKISYWIGLFLAGALAAGAQTVPSSFNYQGVLRGGSGELLAAGTYNVSFRLYPAATGGSAVWGRTYAVLLDTNGLFNVELTDSAGSVVVTGAVLTAAVSSNATLYLGLTVSGSTEIAPRQQLLAVPYALLAGDSKTASGDFTVTGALKANGGGIAAGTWQVTTNLQVGNTASGVATLAMVNGALKVTPKLDGHGTVPIGAILMWSGATNAIPDGWALCNGQNGTPDLRDRFIVGAGNHYAVNLTNSLTSTNVTLTTNNLPAHGHSFHDAFYVEASPMPTNYPIAGGTDAFTPKSKGVGDTDEDNTNLWWRANTTLSTGAGTPFDNRPPYWALAYIMRVQ